MHPKSCGVGGCRREASGIDFCNSVSDHTKGSTCLCTSSSRYKTVARWLAEWRSRCVFALSERDTKTTARNYYCQSWSSTGHLRATTLSRAFQQRSCKLGNTMREKYTSNIQQSVSHITQTEQRLHQKFRGSSATQCNSINRQSRLVQNLSSKKSCNAIGSNPPSNTLQPAVCLQTRSQIHTVQKKHQWFEDVRRWHLTEKQKLNILGGNAHALLQSLNLQVWIPACKWQCMPRKPWTTACRNGNTKKKREIHAFYHPGSRSALWIPEVRLTERLAASVLILGDAEALTPHRSVGIRIAD